MKTSATRKSLAPSGKLILLLLMLAVLALAIPLSASAADAIRYDYTKPELAEGEIAVNANGQWVKFDAAKPYSVTEKVNEKDVTTYYVPLEAVAKTLGCTVSGGKVAYNGASATAEITEKDGAKYVPLAFWASAFGVDGKTMTDGNYLYVTLKANDADMLLDIDGETYAFAGKTYESKDVVIPYRETKVNADADGQAALVIFLHGGSYKGTVDNIMQLKLTPVRTLCQYFTDSGMKANLLVPQCATSAMGGWGDFKGTLADWLRDYIAKNNIDPDRVYISGCSMGAMGTWSLLDECCDLFAAAMPISGQPGALVKAEDVTIPVYELVGGFDSAAMQAGMKEWYDSYSAMGGIVKFETEATYDHKNSCELSMTAERLDWLFSFTRDSDIAYDTVKPVLKDGEFAVNANGQWVKFGAAKPYSETAVVDEKEVVTYYIPLETVSDAMGCVSYKTEGVWNVYFRGVAVTPEVVDKDGAAYVSLTQWASDFAAAGAKTMTDGNYLYMFLNTDAAYIVEGAKDSYTFEAGVYEDEGGIDVSYRAAQVLSEAKGKNALVIFLHGNSYRGLDNGLTLKLNAASDIPDYLTKNGIKAMFVVPQCGGRNWVEYRTAASNMIKDMIADPANNIDPDLVYIMGVSLGGQGTWAITSENPGLFAAAMPVAFEGGASVVNYESLAYTPILAVAGEKDFLAGENGVTSPNSIRKTYETLLGLGAEIDFDIMPGLEHIAVCEAAFTTEHLNWVFSHTGTSTRAYEYIKPAVDKGTYAVNANGLWVDFTEGTPYAVTENKTTTYYLPLADVSRTLGAVAVKGEESWTVYYRGITAAVEAVEKDGVAYAPLTFWDTAFDAVGAKTMIDESWLYVTLNTDTAFTMSIAGKDYTFEAGLYEDDENSIPYREVKVNQNLDGKSALVIFLHGGSYRDNDNVSQLKLTPNRTLCEYFSENGMKAVLLTPQCTTKTGGWVAEAGSIGNWLREYIKANDIDADRVYLSGCSMGSLGTWGVLKECQELFAAAMPISGEPQSDSGAVWVEPDEIYIPIYMAVGELDRDYMRNTMVEWGEAYAERGGTVECDVVPGYDHKTSCELSMNFERLDWLFSFTRLNRGGSTEAPQPFQLIANMLRNPISAVNVIIK